MRWTRATIDAVRSEIKSELDAIESGSGIPARRKRIMSAIDELSSSEDANSNIKRFIYAVSALVLHERDPFLTKSQIRSTIALADTILSAEGIYAGKSKLSFLHGYLYQVLGQIQRKEGDHWSAAWTQELGQYFTEESETAIIERAEMARGNRLLRLGFCHEAVAAYDHLLKTTSHGSRLAQTHLLRVKALRLGGYWDASLVSIASLLAMPEVSEEQRIEADWERICIESSRGQNIEGLLKAVRKDEAHYAATYVVEAHYWARLVSDKSIWERLPSAAGLLRNKTINVRGMGIFYDGIRTIESCYDTVIPLTVRLQRLGELLSRSNEFVGVDGELLLLAASARWLSRVRASTFRILVMERYKSLSLALTSGKNPDVLNQMSDVIDRASEPAADSDAA